MQNAAEAIAIRLAGEAEVVEAERVRDQVLLLAPLPDAEAGGGGERREAAGRDDDPLAPARRDEPGEQGDDQPGGQRDDRRDAGVVDVGRVEAHQRTLASIGATGCSVTAATLSFTDASPRSRIRPG